MVMEGKALTAKNIDNHHKWGQRNSHLGCPELIEGSPNKQMITELDDTEAGESDD
jgi:hypothetical protein